MEPEAIAIDDGGNIYVADNGTIRKITPSGTVRTIAGASQQFGVFNDSDDGAGTAARFNQITDMTVDRQGNLYVADFIGTNGRIRKVAVDGSVTTILHDVSSGGIGRVADGTIYFTTYALASIGFFAADGSVHRQNIPSPVYFYPNGIAGDAAHNLYVVGSRGLKPSPGAGPWRSCSVEKISPDGTMATLVGKRRMMEMEDTCGSIDGQGAAARFQGEHLAIDNAGNLYIADWTAIRKVTPAGLMSTLAGTPGATGRVAAADGKGAAARFTATGWIAIDQAGNLYVTDSGDHTIRKITPDGTVTTIAGKSGESGYVDVPE